MASAVDKQPAAARLAAVAAAGCLPTATRGSQNSYTTSGDTTAGRAPCWYLIRRRGQHGTSLKVRPRATSRFVCQGEWGACSLRFVFVDEDSEEDAFLESSHGPGASLHEIVKTRGSYPSDEACCSWRSASPTRRNIQESDIPRD